MKTKETKKAKGTADKTKTTGFKYDPGNFRGMFEIISKCFTGQHSFIDCSTMMEAMKNQSCCGPMAEKETKDSSRKTKNGCC